MATDSDAGSDTPHTLSLTVNGSTEELDIAPRRLLSAVLRDELGLTGTKRGCDTAKCGACTVLLDGEPVKSCNLLALQADEREVTTVEGLADEGRLAPAQRAFWEEYAFQCGFCTPGFLMSTTALIDENDDPSETEIRDALAGNICRCTGYVKIVEGVREAAHIKRERNDERTAGGDD